MTRSSDPHITPSLYSNFNCWDNYVLKDKFLGYDQRILADAIFKINSHNPFLNKKVNSEFFLGCHKGELYIAYAQNRSIVPVEINNTQKTWFKLDLQLEHINDIENLADLKTNLANYKPTLDSPMCWVQNPRKIKYMSSEPLNEHALRKEFNTFLETKCIHTPFPQSTIKDKTPKSYLILHKDQIDFLMTDLSKTSCIREIQEVRSLNLKYETYSFQTIDDFFKIFRQIKLNENSRRYSELNNTIISSKLIKSGASTIRSEINLNHNQQSF